jgi:hypothetical protein
MKSIKPYVDLDGNEIELDSLDQEERELLTRLRRRARSHADWCDFDTFWMREITQLYDARRVPRFRIRRKALYQIAQDMGARIGIASGYIRAVDAPSPRHKKTG